jgi:hypothetical protein
MKPLCFYIFLYLCLLHQWQISSGFQYLSTVPRYSRYAVKSSISQFRNRGVLQMKTRQEVENAAKQGREVILTENELNPFQWLYTYWKKAFQDPKIGKFARILLIAPLVIDTVLAFVRKKMEPIRQINGWDLYGRVPHDDYLFSTRNLINPNLLKPTLIESVNNTEFNLLIHASSYFTFVRSIENKSTSVIYKPNLWLLISLSWERSFPTLRCYWEFCWRFGCRICCGNEKECKRSSLF